MERSSLGKRGRYTESFNGIFRNGLLNPEIFATLFEAEVSIRQQHKKLTMSAMLTGMVELLKALQLRKQLTCIHPAGPTLDHIKTHECFAPYNAIDSGYFFFNKP